MQVSVIIPVYNTERYLEKCLETVVHQVDVELQVILVDDGSTDSSSRICDDFAACYDFVQVIHTANGGPATAKNVGFEYAGGDYVAFIDSDDELKLDMLSRMYQFGVCAKADIVCCNYLQVDESGEVSHIDCTHQKLVLNQEEGVKHLLMKDKIYSQCWTKMYKRSMLVENRIMNTEGLRTEEDFIYNIQAFAHSKVVAVIDEPLYIYTHRTGSLSKDYFKKQISLYIDNRLLRLEMVDRIVHEQFPNLIEYSTFHCLMYYNELIGKVSLFPAYYRDKRMKRVFDYVRKHKTVLWKYHALCGFSKWGVVLIHLMPIGLYLYYRKWRMHNYFI